MRLGQIRRLQSWLKCSGYMINEDPILKQSRKQVAPIIDSLVAEHEGFENESEIKTPFDENETLEQIEIRCYGHPLTRLLIGGYAPGNYMGTCVSCKTIFIGNKRCHICVSCAATKPINLS